jgi:hypothetical protein
MEFVRIADAAQRQQMLDLLREGFPHTTFDWSMAFKAPLGPSGHGIMLIADEQPQGGILSFEKTETIGGRERRIVNYSSWYIRPQYRHLAVRMMRAASSLEEDVIYTGVSPSAATLTICLRVGGRYVTRGSIVSMPLLNGLVAERGIRVEPYEPTLIESRHRQAMADHADDRFIPMLVRRGEHRSPVLWIRGFKAKGLPAARLMFAPDYALLRSALPAIHAYMLRRHRIVGLYLPRVGALKGLRSIRPPQKGPSIVAKGAIADEDINLLYSEYLYLPLSRPDSPV